MSMFHRSMDVEMIHNDALGAVFFTSPNDEERVWVSKQITPRAKCGVRT